MEAESYDKKKCYEKGRKQGKAFEKKLCEMDVQQNEMISSGNQMKIERKWT